LKLALAIPAVLWCGWPFFVRGFASIRSGWLNMFTLIALGTDRLPLQRGRRRRA
jgi:Cu+-exporting ATPase